MAKTQNARIKKRAKNRSKRTRGMVLLNRSAFKLVMTGVAPQQAYGHQVNGASVAQTHAMRYNLKAATHFGGTGACITTALSWLFGPAADPAVKNPTEQLDIWVLTWCNLDVQDRRETRHTWAAAVGTLLKCKSMSRPRGPIEATINCLMLLGWKPAAPDFWVVADDEWVKLDGNVFTSVQVTARAIHDAQQLVWKSAAKHSLGEALRQALHRSNQRSVQRDFSEATACTKRRKRWRRC